MNLLVSFSAVLLIPHSTAQLAQQKCQEYASFVHTSVQSPVLSAAPGSDSQSQCGIVEVPLIIGGQNAGPKEFPHMAEIGYGNPVMNWHCGGSVIGETSVLSAAHCVTHHEDGPATKVRVGVLNHQDLAQAQEVLIAESLKHPDFDSVSKYNDIALFKLASPLQFSGSVRPACVNVNPALQWEKAIVIGFGQTQVDQSIKSNHLLKLQLFKFATDKCSESYKDNPSMVKGILPSQFCAGENVDNKDSCQGDSGGPIQTVLKEPYCMYNIIGVVSFGKLCGFANTPGIYTDVASFVPWIEANAWK